MGETVDSAENSEMTSTSLTSNSQAPAGDPQNSDHPEVGQQIARGSNPQVLAVDGRTLTNNGALITLSGKPVAYSSIIIRVGNQWEPIPTFPQAHDPGFRSSTAAGLIVNHVGSPEPGVIKARLEVQGQTLTDGGPEIHIVGPDIRLA